MNKTEAAALLGVSAKTLQRGIASSKYKCTRTGTPPFTVLSFTHADLGLDPSYCKACAADEDCFNPDCACAVCAEASIAIDQMQAPVAPVNAPTVTATQAPIVVADDLQEILREANSRGSLIDQHPDLKPVAVDALPPKYVPARSFHQPKPVKQDWRTAKAPERTGYGAGVDDPAWLEMIQYKGRV